jgi:hypothetical protein
MDSPGDGPTAAALAWLLSCDEPAVRSLTRRELLEDRDGAVLAADAAQLLEGPKARALLAGQQPDGGFGVHPYCKWTGAHWRLVSLVELAAPGRRRAGAAHPTPPCRRPLAAGRLLVAPTRHRDRVGPGRGGRLGAVGPQRDAHPQRPAGAQGRRLSGTFPRTPVPTARRSAWASNGLRQMSVQASCRNRAGCRCAARSGPAAAVAHQPGQEQWSVSDEDLCGVLARKALSRAAGEVS